MSRRTKSWRAGQRLVLDHVTTKHKVRIFISMGLQFKEVESVYDDCSKVSEQFGLLYCSFSLSFSNPHFVESLLPYIALFESSSPSTYWSSELSLEYLSHQPPSLTLCESMFRRLLHINATSKVAVVHLMRWCQSSLRYFQVFLFFPCPWNTFLSLNLLKRSL